jgi:hypothetical protein
LAIGGMIGLKGRLWALLDTWQRSEFGEITLQEFGKFGDRGISIEKGVHTQGASNQINLTGAIPSSLMFYLRILHLNNVMEEQDHMIP